MAVNAASMARRRAGRASSRQADPVDGQNQRGEPGARWLGKEATAIRGGEGAPRPSSETPQYRRSDDQPVLHLDGGIEVAQLLSDDALGLDGRLAVLALTVAPRIPFWNGQPATVEIEGEVPTIGLREVALRVVREELRDLDAAAKMENRLIVAAPVLRRLA